MQIISVLGNTLGLMALLATVAIPLVLLAP